MSGLAATFKLGRARQEISFSAVLELPEGIDLAHNRVQAKAENAAGEVFLRIRRRTRPRFSFRIEAAQEDLVQKLESLQHIADAPLSLIWADTRAIYSDRYATTATNKLVLQSSPMTLLGRDYVAAGGGHTDIVSPTGVFTTYDPAGVQGGTNYFSGGGSYNATTREITLGSSPGAAGTIVFANWTYNGALVTLDRLTTRHAAGAVLSGLPLWDVALTLEGA
jgi:hypothetical protein